MYREGEAGMVVVMVMEESVGEGEGEHSWLQSSFNLDIFLSHDFEHMQTHTHEKVHTLLECQVRDT